MRGNRVRSILGIAWTSIFYSGLFAGAIFVFKIALGAVISFYHAGHVILPDTEFFTTQFFIPFLGVNILVLLTIIRRSRAAKFPLSEATNRIWVTARIVENSVIENLLRKFSFNEQPGATLGERTFLRNQNKRVGTYVDVVRFKTLKTGLVQIEIKIPKPLCLLDLNFGAHFILDELRKSGSIQIVQ